MIKAYACGTNYIGTGNDLSECINDSKDWNTIFKNQGFTVTLLQEKQDLKSNFRPAIQSLVKQLKNGEIIGFGVSQSGHGTTGTDANGVKHEGLYFTDGVYWDYEFEEDISGIPDGKSAFFAFDTCFSQGMLKLIGSIDKVRYVHTDEIPEPKGLRRGFRDVITENGIYITNSF